MDDQSFDSTKPIVSHPPQGVPSRLGQWLTVFVGGLLLFIFILALIPLTYKTWYSGRIFPGVSVAGTKVAGLTPNEATSLLKDILVYDQQGKLYFQDGKNVWQVHPRDLGMLIDPQSSADAAYAIGRSGDPFTQLAKQLRAYQVGIDVAPIALYNEQLALAYLQDIAEQVNRPVIDASLEINGIDVVVHNGQVGRELDIPAVLTSLRQQLPTLTDAIIPMLIHETPPVILDASEQADTAREILNAPLVLTVPDSEPDDPGPWTIDQSMLANMLTIEKIAPPNTKAYYQVNLDSQALQSHLESFAPTLLRGASNPRFIFDDETNELELLQSAIIGRALDIETSANLIQEKLLAGEHEVELAMTYTNPAAIDTSTAEELGIRELVSVHTSYFYGSSTPRIQNITTAAARFHGILVAPGSTFSMADTLGDVSLDNGYAEALIIFGNRTIKGVGGGVCQVSTTLFRTVFFGGYPVVERYPHAYRVTYYEQTPSGSINTDLAGLDATVFAPVVDFKFKNNSEAWLLMETYVNPTARTLTWKFYSTNDERSVDWTTTGLRNIVEAPKPIYEENPELAKDEIKQVDWAAEGADVTVTRTVYKNGEVLFSDEFHTHYLPWQARYQYGPGTEGIPDIEEDDREEDSDDDDKEENESQERSEP